MGGPICNDFFDCLPITYVFGSIYLILGALFITGIVWWFYFRKHPHPRQFLYLAILFVFLFLAGPFIFAGGEKVIDQLGQRKLRAKANFEIYTSSYLEHEFGKPRLTIFDDQVDNLTYITSYSKSDFGSIDVRQANKDVFDIRTCRLDLQTSYGDNSFKFRGCASRMQSEQGTIYVGLSGEYVSIRETTAIFVKIENHIQKNTPLSESFIKNIFDSFEIK